jgi:hypothetical protein
VLLGIYEVAYICMFTLAALHCLSIIGFTVHWLAMRKIVPVEEAPDEAQRKTLR